MAQNLKHPVSDRYEDGMKVKIYVLSDLIYEMLFYIWITLKKEKYIHIRQGPGQVFNLSMPTVLVTMAWEPPWAEDTGYMGCVYTHAV